MKNFILGLQFIFKPQFWFMLPEYCPTFDNFVNRAIDNNRVELSCDFYCKVAGYSVWIKNYPYGACEYSGRRASRLTIQRLDRHIQKLRFENRAIPNVA
jgi:hypothetical protein